MNAQDVFVPTYGRKGPPIVKGKGTTVWDAAGKKYLDFGSGIAVTALGHSHPSIVSTLKKQGAQLLHASNLYHMQPQIDLAKRLVKNSFGDQVFFCNSGTEAVEAAIKFARKWASAQNPKKYHVLSFSGGFHGRTFGALSATSQTKFHKGFKPMVSGFHYAPYDDTAAAREMLAKHDYAAIIVEPLQGESGFNQASTAFLKFLRSYATKHKIALIFDEIQCGGGRTGTLWHYQQHGVTPDIMTLAKPLGGGLPLGAVVCTKQFAKAIEPGDHGSTFGGNPLACALGTVVLDTVSKKSFLSQVKSKGNYLAKKLSQAITGCDLAVSIVGTGLMVGVRFAQDPKDVIAACRKNGLLLVKAGNNTVRFMPPLTVSKQEIDKAVAVFTKAINSK
jgi:predicted acetylornithine/succinylornithine family transaminase